jgi:hypothetical protein
MPLVALTVVLLVVERRLRAAAVVAAVTAAIVAPWMIRNYRVDGTFSPSRAGQNLWVSTAPFSRSLLPGNDIDLVHEHSYDTIATELAETPPSRARTVANELLIRKALTYARENPGDVLYVKLRSAVYVFAPRLVPFYAKAPQSRAIIEGSSVRFEGLVRRPAIEEVSYTIFATAMLMLAAVGLYKRRRVLWSDRFLLLTLFVFTAVHAVFFPTTRLVSPMHFVLMFYAGAAVGGSVKLRTQNSELRTLNPEP